MSARAAFLVWIGVGLCGTSLASNACIGHTCTLIGCSDTEQLSFSAPVAQVAETDVSACREQRCWHGRVANADLNTNIGRSEINLRPDDGNYDLVSCLIDTYSEPGNARLTIVWSATQDAPVTIGDSLSATFTDSASNTVLTRSGNVASFSEDFPNGKDCDDVGCRLAVVNASN